MSKKKPKWKSSPIQQKVPRFGKLPGIDKKARIAKDPRSTESEIITWHVKSIDHEGPWGWCRMVARRDRLRYLHGKLSNFETMTWSNIKASKRNHSSLVADISKEARDRLRKINLDQYDNLFALRFSGEERLWGIRQGRIFKILWWDPDHTVYPSYKKYT